MNLQPNDPTRAGKAASNMVVFGDHNRYSIMAVHTRFDGVTWMVFDAETIDPVTDSPAIIRQCDTAAEALSGFDFHPSDFEGTSLQGLTKEVRP